MESKQEESVYIKNEIKKKNEKIRKKRCDYTVLV